MTYAKTREVEINTKKFPDKADIVQAVRLVEVYYKDVFQYHINTEIELNNLRLWALAAKETNNIKFKWNDITFTVNEQGDLSEWPLNMFDIVFQQLCQMFRLKREPDYELKIII